MIFNYIAYSAAGLSLLFSLIGMFSEKIRMKPLSVGLQAAAAFSLLAALIQRSLQIRYVALTGMFDSLLFFAMMIYGISLWLLIKKNASYTKTIQFGVQFIALGLLLIGTSPIIEKEALPPVPALQSAWLLLHVSFSFIGESFFVFSFISSILLLRARDEDKIKSWDALSYKGILIGYAFFSLGALIFGMIWAEAAWGRFWGWDPKETWALITWLIYSAYLHFKLVRKAHYRVSAWISVLGFLATMFTFFGVNYLLRGLHSYS